MHAIPQDFAVLMSGLAAMAVFRGPNIRMQQAAAGPFSIVEYEGVTGATWAAWAYSGLKTIAAPAHLNADKCAGQL